MTVFAIKSNVSLLIITDIVISVFSINLHKPSGGGLPAEKEMPKEECGIFCYTKYTKKYVSSVEAGVGIG